MLIKCQFMVTISEPFEEDIYINTSILHCSVNKQTNRRGILCKREKLIYSSSGVQQECTVGSM